MAQEELFLPPPPLMPRLSTVDRVGGALPRSGFYSLSLFFFFLNQLSVLKLKLKV